MRHLINSAPFLFVFLNLIFWSSLTFGQSYFLEDLNIPIKGRPSVTALHDGGWMVYESDSSSVVRIDKCGEVVWAKKLLKANIDGWRSNNMITLANGAVAILQREEITGGFGARIISLDIQGNILWSKLYTAYNANLLPYSLVTDAQGNIIFYGAEIPFQGFDSDRVLMKIDPSGNTIWTKFVEFSRQWGSCITTNDGGFMLRAGESFAKLDSLGNMEWGVLVQKIVNREFYAPAEVSDGLIFSKLDYLTGEIVLVKIAYSGNGSPQISRRMTGFESLATDLRSLPNGNIVCVFNKALGGNPVLAEMDSDLNVVRAVEIGDANHDLCIYDFDISSNDEIVFSGINRSNDSSLVHGRLNSNWDIGCKSTYSLPLVSDENHYLARYYSSSDSVVMETLDMVNTSAFSITRNRLCAIPSYPPGLDVNDEILCEGDSVTISVRSTFDTYHWSTGDTSSSIVVDSAGEYWITVLPVCDSVPISDTFQVTTLSIPTPVNWVDSVDICESKSTTLDATVSVPANYVWDNGQNTPQRYVSHGGNYFVTISMGNCFRVFETQVSDPCYYFILPNVFTPNGDGKNDYYSVFYEGKEPVLIQVFNRWGVLQFSSTRIGFDWDGTTLTGQKAPDGVYYYAITIGEKHYKGNLTLIR